MSYTTRLRSYISHIFDLGQDTFAKLQDEDKAMMTSFAIRESRMDQLPSLERFDTNKEIISMLAEWIDTEDSEIGFDILTKMKELAIKAYEPLLEDEMDDYAREEEQFLIESRRDLSQLNMAYDKQRL